MHTRRHLHPFFTFMLIFLPFILIGVGGAFLCDHFLPGALAGLMTRPTVTSTATPVVNATAQAHLAAVKALDINALQFPGSTLLGQSEALPSHGIDGSDGAVVNKLFGLHAPVPAGITGNVVVGWYKQQLESRGWQFYVDGETAFSMQGNWEKGDYIVVVGIFAMSTIKYYEPNINTQDYPIVWNVNVGELGYMGGSQLINKMSIETIIMYYRQSPLFNWPLMRKHPSSEIRYHVS